MKAGAKVIYTIPEIKEKLLPLCHKYKVGELYLFGSYARGEASENSDVDLRVEGWKTLELPSAFSFIHFTEECEAALGKKVDLLIRPKSELDDDYLLEILAAEEVKLYGR